MSNLVTKYTIIQGDECYYLKLLDKKTQFYFRSFKELLEYIDFLESDQRNFKAEVSQLS